MKNKAKLLISVILGVLFIITCFLSSIYFTRSFNLQGGEIGTLMFTNIVLFIGTIIVIVIINYENLES